MALPPTSLARAALKLCRDNDASDSTGIAKATLEQKLKNAYGATTEQTMHALNQLLQDKSLQIVKTPTGELFFKPADHQNTEKFWNGLNHNEGFVLQEIENAGTSGTKSKDLRLRTNLQQTQLTKVLKKLETDGLIKSIKSIAAKNQKLYILAGVEPSTEVTGGSWYTSAQEFDHAFVTVLQHTCLDYIRNRSKTYSSTVAEVHEYINSSGVVKGKPMSLEDVTQVLESLVYDAKLEIVVKSAKTAGSQLAKEKEVTYKSLLLNEIHKPFSVPCMVCPVAEDCYEGGNVNPASCVYLTDWLNRAVDGQRATKSCVNDW